MFEPHRDVVINDRNLFKHYAENYLEDFPVKWGGTVSMTQMEKKTNRLEPLWQFLIQDEANRCKDELINYLDENPMEGYWVHVYEEEGGGEHHKIH